MKVAVAYHNGEIFGHFGHCEMFAIYEYGEYVTDCKKTLVETGERQGHQAMADLMKDSKSDNVADILAAADEETISNAFITLSGMQLTTVTNIVWAMAKNANDSIESPREWLNSFDVFPWDIVVPQVLSAALEACISKKKFKKLKETIKIPNRFQSNESQLQPLTED